MPEWDADIDIDAALARALIAGQFPGLDSSALWAVGVGWDNRVWQTADGIAFRFPRRRIVVPGLRRQMAVLPALAPQLPIPIPAVAYPGVAEPRFPWPWFGSPWLPGREIAGADLPAERRDRLAAELGTFLQVLHRQPVPPSLAAEPDRLGRADMARRVPGTRAALAQIHDHWQDPRAAAILEAAAALAPDPRGVLTHGDLHIRHLLVDDAGKLAAIIDWDDVGCAPAAVDLSLYWSAFDAAGRARLLDAYGPVDAATLLRARVLALFFGAILTDYALSTGALALASETLAGLSRTVIDP